MDSINHNRGLKTGLTAGLVLLGGTLLFSIVRVVMKYNAPDAKKKRNVNKNLVRPRCHAHPLGQTAPCFVMPMCLLDAGLSSWCQNCQRAVSVILQGLLRP